MSHSGPERAELWPSPAMLAIAEKNDVLSDPLVEVSHRFLAAS